MNATLEIALSKITALPESEQELAAELLQQFAARHDKPYQLDASERTAIKSGLNDAAKGEFATKIETDDILRKPWR